MINYTERFDGGVQSSMKYSVERRQHDFYFLIVTQEQPLPVSSSSFSHYLSENVTKPKTEFHEKWILSRVFGPI